MKKIVVISTAILLSGIFGGVARANVCLNIQDIASTRNNDTGTQLFFRLRSGKVWRNDLQTPCPDLKYDGFVWVLRGTQQVCDRQQSIRVIRSGEICMLGAFTDVTPARK